MKHLVTSLVVAALVVSLAAPVVKGGKVFLTGHDPDFHAQSSLGAQNLLKSGLNFVTNGTYNLGNGQKFLWVESRISPPSGHLVGENGLIAIGLALGTNYDRANAAELPAVNFADYTAIVIASSFGGLLTRDELDALIARADDIKEFINAGGGLMALAECLPCGANLLAGPTPPDLYGFLPVEVSSIPPSPRFTVTPFGAAPPFNLTNNDINDPTHNSFGLVGGLTPVDLDQSMQATTLAGEVFVGGGGLSQISLLPENATGPINTTHDLTANVFDSLGNPIVGVEVNFAVISGPNAGDSGQDTTDSAGDAFFSYFGDGGPGTDIIEASAMDPQGKLLTSNPASKTWEIPSECFLVLGFSDANTLFGNNDDHLLVEPFWWTDVTTTDIPVFDVPNNPVLHGFNVYLQVYMNNHQQFPTDPIKTSDALRITLGGSAVKYGPTSGMEMWSKASTVPLGGKIDVYFQIFGG